MHAFEYANPTTLKDALALLGNRWGDADVLAGGTDILSLMKDEVYVSKRLVNIKNIKELGGISMSRGALRIGAGATLEQLIENAEIRKSFPSLAAAARGVASPQIRNIGTVGGDLCQRPRCWYYRGGNGLLAKGANGRPLVPNGENKYHAIFGHEGGAYFVSPSSLGPALVALDAKIKLASASGTREVEAAKFFVAPASDTARETALLPNEIVTEILVPAGMRNATYEVREKQALDWPLATASVALQMKGNSVASAKVVLGHVAPTPWLAAAAGQALSGKSLSDSTIAEAADAAVQGAKPLSQNKYKVQLARVAVKRALTEIARGRA
ncbi:MAG: FAD binding domain-containing protein [Bryobacterales bacterium]|nr:FAD binding domain-containing protein [Bryobacterales bacterium]